MDLGDGYSLEHISVGWDYARYEAPALPSACPAMGFSCFSANTSAEVDYAWIACAAFYPTGSEWLIAEYLTFNSNRLVPGRVKVEAFKRCVPFMLGLCEAHGKRLLVPSSSKGVTAILRNMGVAYSSGLDLLVGP